jgi:hypothetical protein
LIKLWLIAGPGGARMDFVAGWLGQLPNFVQSNWSIDLITGQSTGYMQNTKSLDQGLHIDTFLSDHRLQLSECADTIYAGSMHGFFLDSLYNEISQQKIKVFYIDLSGADLNHVRWEYTVKTFLTKNRSLSSTPWPAIDSGTQSQNITDHDRINKFQAILKNHKHNLQPPRVPHTSLMYTKLFQPGGSYYLCECMNIDCDSQYHQYWDQQLERCRTPDELNVWGYQWNKKDFID